jgi:hypothetical protein
MIQRKLPKRRATKSKIPGDYEVGYGRPPKKHQFKPGRSGNPKGRPKGSKNEETILNNLLNRQIEVREAIGRSRKITVLEAMIMKFIDEALRGNPKAAAFLLNRYRAIDAAAEISTEKMSHEDEEILDAFAERLQNQIKKRNDYGR